jgi:hypothetical protein
MIFDIFKIKNNLGLLSVHSNGMVLSICSLISQQMGGYGGP